MAHHLPVVEYFQPLGALNQRRMCAPRQLVLDDVPVVEFSIHGGNLAQSYLDILQIIIRRAERISAGTYYGKPITPFPNPANNPDPQNHEEGHSYFRLLWTSSTDDSTMVEFIIRDFDLYLLGFRSYRHGQWTDWYCCSNGLGWPIFLQEDVTVIPFDGGHEYRPNIGKRSLSLAFYAIGHWYQGSNRSIETLKAWLQVVAVFFSEALRFHYVAMEMAYRIAHDVAPRPLNSTQFGELPMWKRIGNWRNFSRTAINVGLNNGVLRTRHELGPLNYPAVYGINGGFMEMVTGLGVLKRNQNSPNLEPRGQQRTVAYGQHVLDPGFIALNEEYPAEPAGNWWIP